MTERVYRLVIGISMIMFLFMQWNYAMYVLIVLLLIEALSNWRVPILISRLRYPDGEIKVTEGENQHCTIHYEAERFLRWVVFVLPGISNLVYRIDAIAFRHHRNLSDGDVLSTSWL